MALLSDKIKKSDLKDPKKIAEIRQEVLRVVAEKEGKKILVDKSIKKTTLKDTVKKKINKKKSSPKLTKKDKPKETKEVVVGVKKQEDVVPSVEKIKVINTDQAKQIIDQQKQKEQDVVVKPAVVSMGVSEVIKQAKASDLNITEKVSPAPSVARPITQKPKQKSRAWLFIFAMIILVLVFGVLFFIPKTENYLTVKISKTVPFPALIIGDKFVSYKDFIAEVDSVNSYLNRQKDRGVINQIPPRSKMIDDVKKYMIRQEIIDSLARKNNVQVSQEEIDQEIDRIQQQTRSTETIDQVLKEVYGWGRKEFEIKVVQPYLLSRKLAKKMFPDLDGPEMQNAWEQEIEKVKQSMTIYSFVR